MIDIKFYSTLTLSILILFGLGYYFGFKNGIANTQAKFESLNKTLNGQNLDLATKKGKEVVDIKTETVPGVHFIKANTEPICPESHPIKGTFTTSNGFFYSQENKSYNRVKPDICFETLTFARDEAGFIQKF